MKKTILLLTGFLMVVVGCSDDDQSESQNNVQNLSRTEKFSPSLAAYEAGAPGSLKNIKYYESNRVIADSTFNSLGQLERWKIHSYTATTHFYESFSNDNFGEFQQTETFDSSGRLVSIHRLSFNTGMPYNPNSYVSFTYNPDGSIVRENLDPDSGNPLISIPAATNADGLISHFTYGNAYSTIAYVGDKPVTFQYYSGVEFFPETTCTYYSVSMPASIQKSVNEINNVILTSGFEEEIAENCNYYVQQVGDGEITYERTFNDQNYQTYCKILGGAFHQEVYDSETFFYYE